MTTFNFISNQGVKYAIQLPDPHPNLPSAYIFAFHKSGSTLLQNLLQQYCEKIGVPTFSLFDRAFEQSVSTDQIQSDARQCLRDAGFIYTGFRHFPTFELDLKGKRTILLTRDPRDMLVSLYFSVKTSHIIPEGNERFKERRAEAASIDINQFVLHKSEMYVRAFENYRKALAESNLKIYRYEDVIYDKENWLKEMVGLLGIDLVDDYIFTVANEMNVIPSMEDESRHIRQVHPGNYKNKLSEGTIEKLNLKLKDFLAYFEYQI